MAGRTTRSSQELLDEVRAKKERLNEQEKRLVERVRQEEEQKRIEGLEEIVFSVRGALGDEEVLSNEMIVKFFSERSETIARICEEWLMTPQRV